MSRPVLFPYIPNCKLSQKHPQFRHTCTATNAVRRKCCEPLCGEATPHDLLLQITVGAGVSSEVRCLQSVNGIASSGYALLAMTKVIFEMTCGFMCQMSCRSKSAQIRTGSIMNVKRYE